MEETVNGFVRRGGWMDIVEHGEQISTALLECDAEEEYPEAIRRWESWRPKADERLNTEVNEKTAQEASVTKGAGEQAGKSPDEDLGTAKKKIYEFIDAEEKHEAISKWRDSIGYTARAADSVWRKALRSVEMFLYKHIMTRVSPYYFDTQIVQANITKHTRGGAVKYRFEVNISDDSIQEEVSELLRGYEDDVSRWHVTTNKDMSPVKHSEGHKSGIEAVEEDQSVKTDRNIGRDDLEIPTEGPKDSK